MLGANHASTTKVSLSSTDVLPKESNMLLGKLTFLGGRTHEMEITLFCL